MIQRIIQVRIKNGSKSIKMKLLPILEMAVRGGSFEKEALAFGISKTDKWLESEVIANIDSFDVRKVKNHYSVWDGTVLVAFASLSTSEPPIVDDVWVKPEYRGKGVFAKLLWFFKSREGHPKLLIGGVHSEMMQDVIKKLSNFKKSWYKNGEVQPFDPKTLDKFYTGFGSSHWQLMLENNDDLSLAAIQRWWIHQRIIRLAD